MASRVFNIIAKGKDEASDVMSKVGEAVAGIGAVAATAGLALVAGLGAGAIAIGKLTMEASSLENVSTTFANLTEDLGGQALALDELTEATRGMVSETDLMAASNKFLAMGITDTIDGTAEMAEMATQLGMAMGEDATGSMENFALMMANQSIPRLDSFGISSSAVRERMAELKDETEGLSREQAFNQAVMEQGKLAMERLGEQGETSAATVNRVTASFADLKLGIGEEFVPVMETMVADNLQPLIDTYGPDIIEWAGIAAEWLGENLPVAIEWLTEKLGEWSDYWTDTLQPALEDGHDFIEGNFTPVMAGLAAVIVASVIPSFIAWATTAATAAAATLIAIAPVALPIIALGLAVAALVYIWDESWETITTSFTSTWESIKVLFEYLKDWTGTKLTESLGWLLDKVDKIKSSFNAFKDGLWGVQNALKWVRDWIDAVKTSFSQLDIPDWLKPGSPTPFELGLRGIGRAIKALPDMSLNVGVSGQAAAVAGIGGGYVINNYFNRDSVRSDEDIMSISDSIARAIELRGIQPAL